LCKICLYASKIPRNAAMDAAAIIISSEYTALDSSPEKKIIEFAAVADTISPSNNRLGVISVCDTSVYSRYVL
jgi:hypothetical protein